MAAFDVRIQHPGDPAEGLRVQIQIDDGRIRVRAGNERLGSWSLEEIEIERITPFRFRLTVEGEPMIVWPEDPAGFAEETRAFVDLRSARFGLAERLRRAQEV